MLKVNHKAANIQLARSATCQLYNLLTFNFQPLRAGENSSFYIPAAEGVLEGALNISPPFTSLQIAHG